MDNNYLISVASLSMSSDPFFDALGMTPYDAVRSISRDVVESRSHYSLDMRIKVRTADDIGIVAHDIVAASNGVPLDAITNNAVNDRIRLMMLVDKTNYLIHGNGALDLADIVTRGMGHTGNLNFLNSQTLYIYEKFVRGKFGAESTIPYSVFLPSDLGSSLPDADKFTFIIIETPSICGEERLLQSMIDSLTSGGVLALVSCNHARDIYTTTYFGDGLYAMHQILLANDGVTIHTSSGGGLTTFTKA